jgi:hypothetical protein
LRQYGRKAKLESQCEKKFGVAHDHPEHWLHGEPQGNEHCAGSYRLFCQRTTKVGIIDQLWRPALCTARHIGSWPRGWPLQPRTTTPNLHFSPQMSSLERSLWLAKTPCKVVGYRGPDKATQALFLSAAVVEDMHQKSGA